MRKTVFKTLLLFVCVAIIASLAFTACNDTPDDTEPSTVVDITVGESGIFNFTIVYGSGNSLGSKWASSSVMSFVYNNFGVEKRPVDDSSAQSDNELLIGETNRQLSQDLKAAAMNGHTDEDSVWAFGYRDGKLAIYANCQDAFDRAMAMLQSDYLKDGKLVVSSDLWRLNVYTKAQKDADESAKLDAERQEKIESLRAINAKFTQSQFGEYKPMIGENGYLKESPYAAPKAYPTKGDHPRLLLNSSDIPNVRKVLEDPQYTDFAKTFWDLANADCNLGVLEDQYKAGKVYRWNNHYLNIMVAKAMAYLVTEDETYALEAIISVKNAMLTYLMIPEVDSDVYAGGSNIIYATSMVYDWCYDVLTEADKQQLLAGIPNLCISTMEIAYPPTNMSYINGHGTGPQFLRDMMFMATAFSDEAPDWWELIAGRYFEEFLPVANATFGQGWVSQGTANYAYHKLEVQLWAAQCVYTATGNIYLDDGANDGAYFLLSHALTGDGLFFETGDGNRTGKGAVRSWEYGSYIVAAALYKDSLIFANAKAKSNNFAKYSPNSITVPSPAQMLALVSVYLRESEDTGEDRYGKMPLIQYFDGPAGQMTTRDSWVRSDAASVLMKIGTMTMVNHDCYDHGTFQIYYKGLLACTSGSYKKYGGNIHKYYLQSTISANGLLVFNPALADSEPVYTENSDGTTKLTNAQKYYYSGGQQTRSDPKTLNQLLDGTYNMAEMKGAASGYFDNGAAEFGYVAGDLTNAYPSSTVDYVERRMLTVYTLDPEYPMIFLTYDIITSTDASFEKTYLVHTVKEPTVNVEDLSAVIVNGEGKMHVQSVFGADSISKIGGEGYAYWINGKNCTDEYTEGDSADTVWGRIELKTSGELTSRLLTAMYVTDAGNEKTLDVEKFESEGTHSVKIKNIISTFVKSNELAYSEISFATTGTGNYRYYLSGVASGTWTVKVDGVTVTQATAAKDEGILSFVAPAGNVTVTPTSNVAGVNGGRIQYMLNGGALPDGAPTEYISTDATPLPTAPTKENAEFKGWYTSESFAPDTLVTEIPAGSKGTFKVYAKWYAVYYDEDFSDSAISTTEKSETHNGINYGGANKPGSSFTTLTDDNGVPYLLWIKGEKDPAMSLSGTIASSSADDGCLSYTLKMSRDGINPLPPLTVQVIAASAVDGSELSPTKKITILQIKEDGSVIFNNATVATLSAEDITTMRFVLDFNNLEIRLYNENYKHLATQKIAIPTETGATTGEELKSCMTKYLLHIYAATKAEGTGHAVRIYGIRAEDADAFSAISANSAKPIKYELNGGYLPATAPEDFSSTESTVLPTPEKPRSEFLGWYTDPSFAAGTLITEIPPSDEKTFTVYAKWYTVVIDEDYSTTEIDVVEKSVLENGIYYADNSKPGVAYKTESDSTGKYLVWTKGLKDPAILLKGDSIDLTNTSAGAMTFTFKLSKNGTDPVPDMGATFVAGRDVNGNPLSPTEKITAFIIKDGVAYLGESKAEQNKLCDITSSASEIRFVVDFDNLELRAINYKGEEITVKFSIPSTTGATNGRELMRCCYSRILNIQLISSTEERSIRLYAIRVTEGDELDS